MLAGWAVAIYSLVIWSHTVRTQMATSTNAGLVLTIVLLANAPADAQTSPHVSTVVNSASYGTDFSAGSFVSVFGTGLDQTDFLLCPSSLSTCTSQGQGCTAST